MLAHAFVTEAHPQLAETALFFMEKFMETFMETRNARLLRVGTKKRNSFGNKRNCVNRKFFENNFRKPLWNP